MTAVDEFYSYIADLQSALNEHGAERMEDLPAPVYARFLIRAIDAGYLSDDPEEWGEA